MGKRQHKNEPSSSELGERVRRAREAKRMSARQLAEVMFMNVAYISRLEAGYFRHPSPEKLQRLAAALDLNYDDLFSLAGYSVPETLPSFLPYLHAKYDLSQEDAQRLADYFQLLQSQHGITERQSDRVAKDPPLDPKSVDWREL
nr:helix-turn-helix transcriptional regulator [Fodinicola acaciae]